MHRKYIGVCEPHIACITTSRKKTWSMPPKPHITCVLDPLKSPRAVLVRCEMASWLHWSRNACGPSVLRARRCQARGTSPRMSGTLMLPCRGCIVATTRGTKKTCLVFSHTQDIVGDNPIPVCSLCPGPSELLSDPAHSFCLRHTIVAPHILENFIR